MAEINITPLTDVMMVLLVIFMVTTPLLIQSGIEVKLPKAQVVTPSESSSAALVLDREGRLYLNDRPVEPADAEAALKARLARQEDLVVTIRADERISHGAFVAVLDLARRAGARRIAIATEPARPGGKR